jgi:hypothetical protein
MRKALLAMASNQWEPRPPFLKRKEGSSVSSNDNRPVRVTGQERRHPAIRTLARACIELARQKLERERRAEAGQAPDDAPEAKPDEQPETSA